MHPLSGRAEGRSKQRARGRTGKPELRSSQARALVLLQHEPRAPQAMKPALWLRLHPCAGTGITRTDVTAKTARPRSSRVVPSFLTNSFQITHASTSVSLLAAYLPLKPRTPSTHSISLATRTHLKARQRWQRAARFSSLQSSSPPASAPAREPGSSLPPLYLGEKLSSEIQLRCQFRQTMVLS